MRYLVKFTRYQDFVQGQLAESEIDESSALTQLDLAKAQYLAESWTGDSKDRVAVQKAQAAVDPKVQKLDDAHEMARANRKLRQVLLDSLGRDAAVVSRELSRRIGREAVAGRTDRWTP